MYTVSLIDTNFGNCWQIKTRYSVFERLWNILKKDYYEKLKEIEFPKKGYFF